MFPIKLKQELAQGVGTKFHFGRTYVVFVSYSTGVAQS